ncbi:MAG: hypothetical protein ACQ9MH_12335 [Nitrospinales bacterium]
MLETTKLSAPEKLPVFSFPAAVTIVGPESRIILEDGTLLASGGRQLGGIGPHYGGKLGGKLDITCTGKNGIATESPGPAQTENCDKGTCVQISNRAKRSIIGDGGQSPNILHGQSDFTLANAQKLWHRLTQTSEPLHTWEKQNDMPRTQSFGTLNSPAILHYREDATISNMSGTGILIFDGSLKITGQLDWQGIVLVGICEDCQGTLKGTGNLRINGSLILKKTLNTAITFTGAASISYSCQAIERALTAIPKPAS